MKMKELNDPRPYIYILMVDNYQDAHIFRQREFIIILMI